MKSAFLIWTVFLGATVAHSQDYLNNSKEEVINKIRGWTDAGSAYTVKFSQTVVKINPYYSDNINDTVPRFDTIVNLKVSIDGYEKIELEYFFDTLDNDCDSIVIKYFCSKCADRHIDNFLADKYYKWKQVGTDQYLSRRQTNKSEQKDKSTSQTIVNVGSPRMMIRRTPGDPVCTTVFFSIPMMDKDKWKLMTK